MNIFHFDKPKCPLIAMMLEKEETMKGEEKNLVPPYLHEFPIFAKQTLYAIDENIDQTTYNIYDAFHPYIESLKFNEDLFDFIAKLHESADSIDKFLRYGCIYSIVIFIMNSDNFTDTKVLSKVLDILNAVKYNNLDEVTTILFMNVMYRFLYRPNFPWDGDTLLGAARHYIIDQSSIKIPSSTFFQIIQITLSQKNTETLDLLTDVIIQILINPEKYFTSEEKFRIITNISELIKQFNFRAVRIVALVSMNEVTQPVKDCFVVLSSVFTNYVSSLPVFNIIDENQFQEPIQTEFSKFPFHETAANAFEMGFQRVPVEKICTNLRVKNFIPQPALEIIHSFSESIYLADSQCTDCFYTSFFHLANLLTNDPHFIDIMADITIVLDKNINKASLSHVSDFFLTNSIFNPKICAFSNTEIPEVIKYIRKKTIFYLSKTAPSVIGDLIISKRKNPFLAAEIIGHILYCEAEFDYRFLITSECLIALSEIISRLWNSYDSEDYAKVAFSTVMSFVFNIFEDEKSIIDAFNSFEFSTIFLSLITERNLLNMIFMVIKRYFIEVKDTKIDKMIRSIKDFYSRMITDEKNEISLVTVIELGEVIIYGCSHNALLSNQFEKILDILFSYAKVVKSDKILAQVLKIFSYIAQSFTHYNLSARHMNFLVQIIKINFQNDHFKYILSTLVNIAGMSNSLSHDTPYVIRLPSIVPLTLIPFGDTIFATKIISLLQKMTQFSQRNCYMLHEAGIDQILIDFLSSENNEITFRGCKFTLNVPKDENIYSIIFGITSEISCFNIAMKLVKFMIDPPNIDFARKLLNSQITESNNHMKNQFQCGTDKPFCVLTDCPSMVFNKVFVFSFWVNIDIAASNVYSKEYTIIKITSENATFRLFYLRQAFFYLFTTKDEETTTHKTYLCNFNKKGWTFCSFICQRFSLEKSAVGFFAKDSMLYCQEVQYMQFPIEDQLVLELGGNDEVDDFDFVTMGSFALGKTIISEEGLKHIESRGDDGVNDDSHYYFNSFMFKGDLPSKVKFIYTSKSDYECQGELICKKPIKKTLHFMLGAGNHLMSFIPLFNNDVNLPDGLIEILIGLIKFTLGGFKLAQNRFNGFCLIGKILESNLKLLTYNLYIAFYSIMDTLSVYNCMTDLFNGIVLNVMLWMKSPAFPRIVHHWAVTAVAQFPSFFRNDKYFVKLVKVFPEIYEKMQNEKLINDLVSLLTSIGMTSLTQKDLDILFSMIFNYYDTNPKMVFHLLLILEQLAAGLPTIVLKQECIAILLRIIEVGDVDSAVSAVKTLAILQGSDEIAAISIALMHHPKKAEIFDSITPLCLNLPMLSSVATVMALGLDFDQKEICSALIGGLAFQASEQMTAHDKLWFVWPLLLLLSQLKDDSYDQCYNFIKHFALKSIKNLEKILDFIQIVSGALKIDCNLTVLKLIEESSSLNIPPKDKAIYIYKAIFFRFCDNSFDPVLLDAYINSPFYDHTNVDTEKKQVNDVLTLFYLLKSASNFSLRFGISVSENCSDQSIVQRASQIEGCDFEEYPYLYHLMTQLNSKDRSFIKESEGFDEIEEFSNKFTPKLVNLTKEVCESLLQGKNLVSMASTIQKNPLNKYRGMIPPLKSSFEFGIYMNSFHIDEAKVERSSKFAFGRVPSLFCLKYDPGIRFYPENQTLQLSDIDLGDQSIISLPGVKYTLGVENNVCLFISNDKIQVISITEPIMKVKPENIDFIIEKPPNSVEIFLKSKESIYIDFTPTKSSEIMEHLKVFFPQCAEPVSNILLNNLRTGEKFSNFEILVIIELITGKSFHLKEHNPEIRYNSTKATSYTSNICIGVESIENVVNSRKLTEKFDFTAEFMPIIGHVTTDYTIGYNCVYGSGLHRNEIVKTFFYNHKVAVFTKNGELRIFDFDATGVSLRKIYNFAYKENYMIYKLENSLHIIDPNSLTLYTFTQNDVVHEKIDVPNLVSASKNKTVQVINRSSVKTDNMRVYIPGFITTLDFSDYSSVFAVGTYDCKIFMHNALHKEFICTIQCEEEPQSLLITDSMNFVFAFFGSHVSIYTVYGQKICDHTVEIVCWQKFLYKGIDFVVACDSQRDIVIFDPTDFRKPYKLGHTDEPALSVSVVHHPTLVCVFTIDGRLHLLPITPF